MSKRLLVLAAGTALIGIWLFSPNAAQIKSAPILPTNTIVTKDADLLAPSPILPQRRPTSVPKVEPKTLAEYSMAEQMAMSNEELNQIMQNDPGFRCLINTETENPRLVEMRKDMTRQYEDLVGSWISSNNMDSLSGVQENSNAGRYLLALAKSGFIVGFKFKRDDNLKERYRAQIQEATVLLDQVIEADPENSAPLVAAAILQYLLQNPERTDQYLAKIRTTTRYDTYLGEITSRVWSQVRTGEDYFNAAIITMTKPMIDQEAIREFLKAKKLAQVAQQMTNSYIKKTTPLADVDFEIFEYSIGKQVLDSLKLGHELPAVGEVLELAHNNPNSIYTVTDRYYKNCDLAELDSSAKFMMERKLQR